MTRQWPLLDNPRTSSVVGRPPQATRPPTPPTTTTPPPTNPNPTPKPNLTLLILTPTTLTTRHDSHSLLKSNDDPIVVGAATDAAAMAPATPKNDALLRLDNPAGGEVVGGKAYDGRAVGREAEELGGDFGFFLFGVFGAKGLPGGC